MHHPTDRIAHTTAFVTPVVGHWLEREIAQLKHIKQEWWGFWGQTIYVPISTEGSSMPAVKPKYRLSSLGSWCRFGFQVYPSLPTCCYQNKPSFITTVHNMVRILLNPLFNLSKVFLQINTIYHLIIPIYYINGDLSSCFKLFRISVENTEM